MGLVLKKRRKRIHVNVSLLSLFKRKRKKEKTASQNEYGFRRADVKTGMENAVVWS